MLYVLVPTLTQPYGPEMVYAGSEGFVFRSPRQAQESQESSASPAFWTIAEAWCQGLPRTDPVLALQPRRSRSWQHKASLSPWVTVPGRAWAFTQSSYSRYPHCIWAISLPHHPYSPGPAISLSSGCCLDILLLCYIAGACRQGHF